MLVRAITVGFHGSILLTLENIAIDLVFFVIKKDSSIALTHRNNKHPGDKTAPDQHKEQRTISPENNELGIKSNQSATLTANSSP